MTHTRLRGGYGRSGVDHYSRATTVNSLLVHQLADAGVAFCLCNVAIRATLLLSVSPTTPYHNKHMKPTTRPVLLASVTVRYLGMQHALRRPEFSEGQLRLQSVIQMVYLLGVTDVLLMRAACVSTAEVPV